ncbi:MAG: hypothetical protein REH83_06570 [Rickettsiella sp.]|nr:hypothetical protein [Rickettsiella sp.]
MFYQRRRNLTAPKKGNDIRAKSLSKAYYRPKNSIGKNGSANTKEFVENNATINALNNATINTQVGECANSLDSTAGSKLLIKDKENKSTLSKKVNNNTAIEDKISSTSNSEVVFFKKEKTEEVISSPENNSPVPAA